MEYSAGMVSCLFWLSETRKTAEFLIAGKDKNEIKELAVKENIYQVRAEDRARRIFGVAIKRLESLPGNLVDQIANGDIGTVKLLVLISIMKTDLLFLSLYMRCIDTRLYWVRIKSPIELLILSLTLRRLRVK